MILRCRTGRDTALQPDQSKPDPDLVNYVLTEATGKDEEGLPKLTVGDLIRISTHRRAESRETNGQFTQSFFHKFLGSSSTCPSHGSNWWLILLI